MHIQVARKIEDPTKPIHSVITTDVSGLPPLVGVELPKLVDGKENVPRRSCFPAGLFVVIVNWSDKHQKRLGEIVGVPNRKGLRFDIANSARELLGCIAVGLERKEDIVIRSRWADDEHTQPGGAVLLNNAIIAAFERGETITCEVTEESA